MEVLVASEEVMGDLVASEEVMVDPVGLEEARVDLVASEEAKVVALAELRLPLRFTPLAKVVMVDLADLTVDLAVDLAARAASGMADSVEEDSVEEVTINQLCCKRHNASLCVYLSGPQSCVVPPSMCLTSIVGSDQ